MEASIVIKVGSSGTEIFEREVEHCLTHFFHFPRLFRYFNVSERVLVSRKRNVKLSLVKVIPKPIRINNVEQTWNEFALRVSITSASRLTAPVPFV